MEKARKIIGKSLRIQGFDEVRKYIFGDQMINFDGSESMGIPAFTGYAAGYHAVQFFLKKTGVTIEQATPMDGEETMKNQDTSNKI